VAFLDRFFLVVRRVGVLERGLVDGVVVGVGSAGVLSAGVGSGVDGVDWVGVDGVVSIGCVSVGLGDWAVPPGILDGVRPVCGETGGIMLAIAAIGKKRTASAAIKLFRYM
jgi:hypothetical protein